MMATGMKIPLHVGFPVVAFTAETGWGRDPPDYEY
jgi:hypothetical protein